MRTSRLLITLSLALLASALSAGTVSAHEGARPLLDIGFERLEPGQTFTLIGSDIAPSEVLTIELAAGSKTYVLGSLVSGWDGHFETDVRVPEDVPEGYAQLRATFAGVPQADVSLYLSSEPGPVQAPARLEAGQWWADPSVLTLAAMLAGTSLALLGAALRRGRLAERKNAPLVR